MTTLNETLRGNGQKPFVQKMQASLQLLPLIMNNIPQAVFWKDRDLVYLGCNQAFADDAGFSSPEEIVGKTDFDMPWRDQAELYRADDKLVIENGEPKLNYEEPQTTPIGSTIWLRTSKIPVQESGQVVAVLGMYEDVTARKQAEKALLDSEDRFRRFTEATSEGLVFHEQGKIVDANPAALAMFGLTENSEFIGRSLLEFVLPDSHQLIFQKMELETVLPYEVQCIRKDNSIFPVETSTRTYKSDDRIIRATSIRDITERKLADETIKNERQRFQTILETVRVPTIISRLSDGQVLYANEALAQVSQVDLDKLIGFKTGNFYANPEDRKTVLEALREYGHINDFEVQFQRTDGSRYWALLSSRVVEYEGERCVLSTYIDITQRKQAEKALIESQQLLQTVMDNIPQSIFWKDSNLIYLGCNRAFTEDAGLASSNDIVGKTDWDMPWKEQAELYRADDSLVMKNGISKLNYEEPQTTPDGSTIWLRTSKIPLHDSNGTVSAVLGMYEDITDRKRAENLLQQSEANLSSALHIAQMGYWEFDIPTQMFTFNDQYYSLHGTTAAEVGGYQMSVQRFAQEFVYPEDAPAVGLATQQAIETTDPNFNVQIEARVLRKNGEIRWVTVWFRIEKDDEGRTIKLHGVNQDITERKRLEQEVQSAFERRGLQVQISTQVSQSIAAASSLEELYERVVTQVKEQFGYYHTQILRYDALQKAVVLVTGYGEAGAKMLAAGHRLPMGEGLIGTAAATGETVLRSTLENDPDWQPNPLLSETKGEIAVPIKLGNDILGVLDVQSNVAGALDADDQLLLEGLCGQIATAIESTRLGQEMAERLEEINRLYRAMSREGWQAYRETANIPSSFVFDQGGLRPVDDISLADELFASMPLTVPGGEVIGTLAIADDPQRPISPDDKAFLEQVSEQVALALESARLFEQTQAALVESEDAQKLIRNVIDSTDDWIFVKDRQHRYQLVNQGYSNSLHIPVEAFIGKNDLELGFPEELVKGNPEKGIRGFWADDLLVMETGMPQHFPDDPAMIDGQIRIFDTIKIPLRDATGNIWGVLAFSRDLTDRKHAEEIIAQRATQLAAVANVSTTASTLLNPDQLLQSVVDLTREHFGLYHAHIYLADESWQTLLLAAGAGEVGRQMVADGWNISLDHESSIVADAARNRKFVIANDVYHDKDSSFLSNRLLPETRSEMAVPIIVGDKLLGVFDVQSDETGHFTDEDANIYITLASQVGVALQNARLYVEQAATLTQLRELDKLKSSFLANMSHELRTPLNSILGFTDVIMEGLDGPLTEHMDNDLRLIQKNGQHLLHLINDVLDMAKIEAGRMNLNPESFKAYDVMEEVTSITSTLASEKNLSLVLDEDSDQDAKIYADRTRLRQVMINLVNNAIKFTETGRISIKVAPMEGARILITVKDTGIGVAPDKLDAIFQEFTQVDSSTTRKAGGTGLGLPISRRLVEMHGGRLWAESTGVPGEGSMFYVEMPVEARITEVVEKQAK